MTKSLLRHILTAIGSVLVFIGLGKFSGFIDYLVQNLDAVWEAVTVLIGFVLGGWGFFKDRPADFKNT